MVRVRVRVRVRIDWVMVREKHTPVAHRLRSRQTEGEFVVPYGGQMLGVQLRSDGGLAQLL